MKLLNYTSLRYMLFAALLTLISIPIFYFSLNKIFLDSIDKFLRYEAAEMPAHISTIQSERELQLWRTLDKDLTIVPADSSTFSATPFDAAGFRILQKQVDIMGRSYIINIKASLLEKEELIRAILFIQLGILFLLLSGAVMMNYLINRKVWKPFYECLQFVQEFDVEHYNRKETARLFIHEFEQLNQSINALLTRLHRSYYSQKEFLENVSHELKTPLTILKFKLELLLQDQALSHDQGLLVADMHKEIGQMQELNNNLLLLSKIENGQFDTDESFNMIAIVQEVVEELSFLAASKMQTFDVHYACDHLLLQSNKMLLKILVRNLLVNAIRYSDMQAEIKVLVNQQLLQITNPGQALEIPADKLFQRFGKRSRNGLGLAIVKNIADYNHYRISYEYSSGMHVFCLQWS